MIMGAVVALPRKEIAPKRPTPLRRPNIDLRTREYLTEHEVDKLVESARSNRHGHRDSTMILLAFRHGLRASELVALEWTQVSFTSANLHVRRRKNGTPATHPLTGLGLRSLRRLKREQKPSQFVFTSERGNVPFTTEGVARLVQRAGKAAGLTIKVHVHMLRHACGFALANAGHDTRSLQAFLGHRNIQNTVKYTALRSDRFKDFWRD